MKSVLVTGGTGFIGKWTLNLLKDRNFEVHSVTSKPCNQDDLGECFSWHRCDLSNSKEIQALMGDIQPSHLLHLAWYTNPQNYWISDENLKWLNNSINLLNSFLENGGKRVVTAGTCAEYDWRYGYCNEFITPIKPQSIYGVSKASLFEIQRTLAKEMGLSSSWGRVFFLYGPYEYSERFVPSLIHSVISGKRIECIHSNQIRDYLYVADVSSAFVALLDNDIQGPVNIGSGIPVRLREIALKIQEQRSKLTTITFGDIPACEETYPLIVADTRRLNKEVKWFPGISLDEGIARTFDWWKEKLC